MKGGNEKNYVKNYLRLQKIAIKNEHQFCQRKKIE